MKVEYFILKDFSYVVALSVHQLTNFGGAYIPLYNMVVRYYPA